MSDFLKLVFGLGCLALLVALGLQYDAAQKLGESNKELRAEVESLKKNAQLQIRRDAKQVKRLRDEVEESTVQPTPVEEPDGLALLEEPGEENVGAVTFFDLPAKSRTGAVAKPEPRMKSEPEMVPPAEPEAEPADEPEAEPPEELETEEEVELPEQVKQIIAYARAAPNYVAAKAILHRCDPLIDDLDGVAEGSARKHLQKVKEDLLMGEIERVLSGISQVRGEILQNYPSASRPSGWIPSGIYRAEKAEERTAYERAMPYYNLFGKHNANVAKMSRLVTIVKRRMKELSVLQGFPGAYEEVLKELQEYPAPLVSQTWTEGERIVRLAVPRRPRLLVKQRTW